MKTHRRISPLLLFVAVVSIGLSRSALSDVVEYFANGESTRRLEVGSGRDGAFSDGPTQTGIGVSGTTITFDTSVKSVYEFTSFSLSAGFTIEASGSNPLVIRVSGPATLSGTIHLDGSDGVQGTAASPGTAGSGGPGGGSGGSGGAQPPTDTDGSDGSPRSGSSIGGSGGPNETANNGQNAGGGGCNGPGATSGQPNVLAPSNAAVCSSSAEGIADGFETAFFSASSGSVPGGAGGGGGGTRDLNAANSMNGSGGGGGGGAFVLTASGDVVLNGTVTARGGAGGDANLGTSDYGSAGGGGSGGSVWIQSAGRVSGSGTVTVTGGQGGQDVNTTNLGGNGSRGVFRIDAAVPGFSGTVTGGSVDRTFVVYPATVEFTLRAGPACGTVDRDRSDREKSEDLRNFLANSALWIALVSISILNPRRASSSRSRSSSRLPGSPSPRDRSS